jgi:hypothetical protein
MCTDCPHAHYQCSHAAGRAAVKPAGSSQQAAASRSQKYSMICLHCEGIAATHRSWLAQHATALHPSQVSVAWRGVAQCSRTHRKWQETAILIAPYTRSPRDTHSSTHTAADQSWRKDHRCVARTRAGECLVGYLMFWLLFWVASSAAGAAAAASSSCCCPSLDGSSKQPVASGTCCVAADAVSYICQLLFGCSMLLCCAGDVFR